jgi:hypothetical protein
MKMRITIEVERVDGGSVTDADLQHATDTTAGLVDVADALSEGTAYDSPAGSYAGGDAAVAWSYTVEEVKP